METLTIYNPDPRNDVVFSLYHIMGSEQLDGMNLLKRRKAFRSSKTVITVAPNSHRELVAETGMTVSDIRSNPELNRLLANHKLWIVEE